MTENIWSRL